MMKWLNFILGILVSLMGVLPFLENVLPKNWKVVPSSGAGYSVIILILGILIVVNTYKEKRHGLRLR